MKLVKIDWLCVFQDVIKLVAQSFYFKFHFDMLYFALFAGLERTRSSVNRPVVHTGNLDRNFTGELKICCSALSNMPAGGLVQWSFSIFFLSSNTNWLHLVFHFYGKVKEIPPRQEWTTNEASRELRRLQAQFFNLATALTSSLLSLSPTTSWIKY